MGPGDASEVPARRRLLVADDDPNVAWLVSRALGDDFEVSAAPDGQHAVEDVRRRPPDLLVLDLEMPLLGGLDACRLVRAAHATLPIVILTGNPAPETVREAFAAGASDYLVKPFSPGQLRARLRACLLRVGG